jgi:hypothetical protein
MELSQVGNMAKNFCQNSGERYVKPILFKTVPCVNVEA